MITEDYVSFETAKLLKEKGYWNIATMLYKENGDIVNYNVPLNNKGFSSTLGVFYEAPTLQMAMKWLREVHHWHIFIIPKWEDVEYMPGEWEEKMIGYQYTIIDVGEVNRKNEHRITTALSSESACEAAIKYCLENLI